MSNDFEEYKFTAYLLGELDEAERREVEEILAESPSARRQLDELRETTRLLQEGMQAELMEKPGERLDEARRARVDRAIAAPGRKATALPWSLPSSTWTRALSIAASVVILASLSYWVINLGITPEKEMATSARRVEFQEHPKSEPAAPAGDREALSESQAKLKPAQEPAQEKLQNRRKGLTQETQETQVERKEASAGPAPAEVDVLSTPAPPPPSAPALPAAPAPVLSLSLRDKVVGGTAAPASVAGEIKDMTGGPLPGAEIKLKSPTGDVRQIAVTNDNGGFTLSNVPSGKYLLEAEMPGFKTATLGPIDLSPGESRKAEMTLAVGEVTEMVTVSADVSELQLSSASRARREAGGRTGGGKALASQAQALAKQEVRGGVVGGVAGGVVGRDEDRQARADAARIFNEGFNTESYAHIVENPFVAVSQDPLSTFSIDVDTASYANVRRFLTSNQRPPADAVRIEEMLNYFQYDYAPPSGREPIAVHAEVAQAFWAPKHRLVRVGLKAREIPAASRPAVNLVFLVDVSGSMMPPEKLPLLCEALRLLTGRLEAKDTVALVTYAGSSQLVLPPTSGAEKATILRALDSLVSGGSTNGGGGIRMAYEQALRSFDKKSINRVVLATDGDFNVGMTNQGDLVRYVEEQAKKGVLLTVLGFGTGNYKDSMLEKLADKGDGNYAYIDNLNEAQRVLVEQMGGTLLPVAKDVKIQVEFNPAEVAAYRLVGYENRVLANQDFADDTKDAGEMGAGHAVTALYEVVPVGVPISLPDVEPLKYQTPGRTAASAANREMLTLKIRYKEPAGGASRRMEVPITDSGQVFDQASDDFRFASAVASFGMILRNSPHKGATTLDGVVEIARGSKGFDPNGLRDEFVRLVEKARELGVATQR